MKTLNPCPFRQMDDEGQILCNKIKSGDRQVSPDICQSCPIANINCMHLRATLLHQTRPPIVVHYGNGKTEVWDGEAPAISLQQAGCAVKLVPILTERECANCALRQAMASSNVLPTAPLAGNRTRHSANRTIRATPALLAVPATARIDGPAESCQGRPEPAKVIHLDEWLAKRRPSRQSTSHAVRM